jgi:hypothetical protein
MARWRHLRLVLRSAPDRFPWVSVFLRFSPVTVACFLLIAFLPRQSTTFPGFARSDRLTTDAVHPLPLASTISRVRFDLEAEWFGLPGSAEEAQNNYDACEHTARGSIIASGLVQRWKAAVPGPELGSGIAGSLVLESDCPAANRIPLIISPDPRESDVPPTVALGSRVTVEFWTYRLVRRLTSGIGPSPCTMPKLNDPTLLQQVRQAHSNTICNAQDLAALVFERYETGLPIGIVRVSNFTTPTYLITLQGSEFESGYQANSALDDYLEGNGAPSDYRRAVIKAIDRYGLRDANMIIAANSLGGLVAQNMIIDGDIERFGLRLTRIIDFGVPGRKAGISLSPNLSVLQHSTVRFESLGDAVLNTFNAELPVKYGTIYQVGPCASSATGPPDPLLGEHNDYPFCAKLRNYDALGNPAQAGRTCLVLDRQTMRAFEAPNSRSLLAQSSEVVGEQGMDRMALSQLGYQPLMSSYYPRMTRPHTLYPNGYDNLYWDQKGCALVIGEAKGGYNGQSLCAILGKGYGFKQGSIGWALGAASRVYRSRTVSDDELYWALLVYQTICDLNATGQLNSPINPNLCRRNRTGVPPQNVSVRVEVFHTENLNGQPGNTEHFVTDRSTGCSQRVNCECR